MLAKKPLGHREHGASDVSCKILHLLPERIEGEGLCDMLDKVSLLMVPRVLELLRGRGARDDHDRSPQRIAGIGQPGIEMRHGEAAVCASEVLPRASNVREQQRYLRAPVRGDTVEHRHAPVIGLYVEVLPYHFSNMSSHIMGLPLPMQSATKRVKGSPS